MRIKTALVGVCLAAMSAASLVGCTPAQDTRDHTAGRGDEVTPAPARYGLQRGNVVPDEEIAPAAEPEIPRSTARPQPRRSYRGWPSMSGGGYIWTSLAYPTGDPATSAIGIEKGVPSEVRLGQPFTYKICVTNLTSLPLQDVVVTEAPQANFRYESSDPAAQQGPGGSLVWALGELGPNEQRCIDVTGVATGGDIVGTCATVTYNTELCTTIPVVAPELRLVKRGPAEVLRCEPIDYIFEVSNTGTGTIRNVKVSDPLPEGLQTASGSREITFNVDSLAPGQTRSFQAQVQATRPGTYTNRATASAAEGLQANSGTVTTAVRAPRLEITKTGTRTSFIGRTATYRITVRNVGDGPARDARVVDQLQPGLAFRSASDGGTASGQTVTWNLGTLEPGASRTVEVVTTSTTAAELCNTATASAFCAEAVTAQACTEFTGIPAILLEVIDIEDPVEVGGQTTYVITATNQGSAPDNNIAITCQLENAQAFVSAGGATQGTAAGQTVTFAPLPVLGVGQRAEWRVTIRATSGGDIRFAVQMDTDNLNRPVRETEATNQYE